MTDPYQRLLALGRVELDLAQAGDWEGLEPVAAERESIAAELPARPPAAARPALLEMARMQAEITALLKDARTRLTAEMGAAERRSTTARGYGRTNGSRPRGTITVSA